MPAKKALKCFWIAITLSASVWGQERVLDDTYFYGQSPPVYPAPAISGTGVWQDAYARAADLVSHMTLEEKVNLTGGYRNSSGCGGNIPAIPRLGFDGMCLADGPAGVRATDFVNGYPAGVHVGASWNKNLTYARAAAIGGEFYRKGTTIPLGPPVPGCLGRVALGGRNWEGFTNDPYLNGILSAETVKGIQDRGLISCTKHFIGNEQESHRNPLLDLSNNNKTIESVSSNIDDRTMHELYMWPFADAIHAGTASIMCSYNRVNNSYACHNSKTLNGLLKTELGFQGFVMSDWDAQHTGIASAEAGLDMVMPYGFRFWGSNLTDAVRNGSLPESRVNDMATRIMAAWYFSGRNNSGVPPIASGFTSNYLVPHRIVDARDPGDAPVLFQGAVEGHVLVKNINQALPLRRPRMLSIYGYDARNPNQNVPGVGGFNGWSISLQGNDWRSVICGFFSQRLGTCPSFPSTSRNGTLIVGGGSGGNAPAYVSAPINAIQERARRDGTTLFWDFDTEGANSTVNSATDACFIFLNAAASEGVDRPELRDDFSDALVTNIASQCNNTMVVIHNAGVRLVDQWIENPNVTAVIFAHLPGQDSGYALADILYGDVSPSGKLPYTVARNESDYGTNLGPLNHTGWDFYFPQDDFTEGVYIDYRAFDARNITPRFEFGFGLTYTTFTYSNLVTVNVVPAPQLTAHPVEPILSGGHADLWDIIASATADITNTGSVAAAEIAQLYVGIPVPDHPIRQLRGFEKVSIEPGQTATVEFLLRRRDLSFWNVTAQQWELALGSEYPIYVGASSRNLPLVGSLSL